MPHGVVRFECQRGTQCFLKTVKALQGGVWESKLSG